jgi:hypothetical protein
LPIFIGILRLFFRALKNNRHNQKSGRSQIFAEQAGFSTAYPPKNPVFHAKTRKQLCQMEKQRLYWLRMRV